MNVERLVELLAVVEAGSITAAAAQAGVTRSTLSRRLTALEDQVGTRLLQRNSRGLRLTYAGELLVERARRIVEEAEEAWRLVRTLNDLPAGPLRISTPPTELFQDLVVGFAEAYPDVRVWVEPTSRHVNLLKERFDVALRFGTVTNEGLIARHLLTAPFALVASPAYLNTYGTPEEPGALANHRCIAAHGQSGAPHPVWPLTDGSVFGFDPHFACDGLMMSLRAALAGLGIALLPEGLTARYRQVGALVSVLAGTVGMNLSGHLVYLERRYMLPVVRAFIDYTVAYYDNLDDEAWPPLLLE